jgi:hypothetical protein
MFQGDNDARHFVVDVGARRRGGSRSVVCADHPLRVLIFPP